MYWIMFFDGSSKIVSDYELNKLSEDEKDSIVKIIDMDESIILDTQNLIYNKLH